MRFFASSLAMVAAATFLSSTTANKALCQKTGPKSIVYVEVNNNALSNVGKYKFSSSGSGSTNGSSDPGPVFDIAIIFAANINWNGSAAVLFNNAQVQATLDDAANQIAPLQAQGTKVLLSILGNHQGAGISNFPSQQAAADFAAQVRDAVVQYGLDGVDLDDEYADYGTNGTPQPNDSSAGWLVAALRDALGPDRLVTLYAYGPAAQALSSASPDVGADLSYAWNPIYGTYDAPSVPGLDNSRLAAAAIDYTNTPQDDAVDFAQRTVSDGYGAYMTYDLQSTDQSAYISAFTQALYGQAVTYTG